MKTLQEQIVDRIIKFLENHIIECGYHEGCGRCDEARDIVEELSALKAQAEQEKVTDETLDLQQYVTNLLYYAHVEAMDMHSIDFDKWVEREVNNIAEYLNNEKVTDEDIENYADNACCVADEDEPEHTRIEIMLWDGFVQGAKAMRDGLITHNK